MKTELLDALIDSLPVSAFGTLSRFFLIKGVTFYESVRITIGGLILGTISGFLCRNMGVSDGVTYVVIALISIFAKDLIEYGVKNIPSILNAKLKKWKQ